MKSIIVFGFAALALSGCGPPASEITLQNKSGNALQDVRVLVGGNVIEIDELSANGTTKVTYYPTQDSALVIEYKGDLPIKDLRCFGDVYVTNADWERFSVAILPGGECKVLNISGPK